MSHIGPRGMRMCWRDLGQIDGCKDRWMDGRREGKTEDYRRPADEGPYDDHDK